MRITVYKSSLCHLFLACRERLLGTSCEHLKRLMSDLIAAAEVPYDGDSCFNGGFLLSKQDVSQCPLRVVLLWDVSECTRGPDSNFETDDPVSRFPS